MRPPSVPPLSKSMGESQGLRRTTGGLFVLGALTFTAAATLLSSTFDWPDILRQPADVVLPAFTAGGTSLVWIWFATAWTYAILAVPILLLPAALGRSADPVLRAATAVGATSVLLSLIGFLRWVFVVPPLAESYVAGDATMKAAIEAAWTAQHQFGGALLGEHLGQLLVIGWSITVSAIIVRTRAPSPLAWRSRAHRQCDLPAEPGRHHRYRDPQLPGVGPCRPDRQHRLGPVGSRPWRHPSAPPSRQPEPLSR